MTSLRSFMPVFLYCLMLKPSIAQWNKGISIMEASSQAVTDYFDEKYEEAIRGFETALVHYKMLKNIDTVCGARCNSPNISKELEMSFDDLFTYGNLLAQANCVKICKEEHPFSKSKIQRPRDDYIRDFESRLPYNYLQFAYFQTGKIKQACQAAYTFEQGNPSDTEMKDNIEYYKGLDGVSEDFFTDLEGKPYIRDFKTAVQFYDDGQYQEAVKHFEACLEDYFKVHDECKSLCYVRKDPEIFHGFLQSVSARYIPAIECSLNCDEKLRPAVGEVFVDDLLQRIYSYMQFSYYQLGEWKKAVPAAAAALLLAPNDETTINNIQYYSENAAAHNLSLKVDFQPRTEAVKHHLERKASLDILSLMRESVDYEDEMEVPEETVIDGELMNEIAKQVVMQLGNKLRGDIG